MAAEQGLLSRYASICETLTRRETDQRFCVFCNYAIFLSM